MGMGSFAGALLAWSARERAAPGAAGVAGAAGSCPVAGLVATAVRGAVLGRASGVVGAEEAGRGSDRARAVKPSCCDLASSSRRRSVAALIEEDGVWAVDGAATAGAGTSRGFADEVTKMLPLASSSFLLWSLSRSTTA
jgi:hypothetical protein